MWISMVILMNKGPRASLMQYGFSSNITDLGDFVIGTLFLDQICQWALLNTLTSFYG